MKRIALLLALAATEPCFAQDPATRNAADLAIARLENNITIPAVAYEKAALTNILADVEAKANAAAPAGSARIRIRLGPAVTNDLPTVTLRANSIGLLPLLSMLADMTGLEHRITAGEIVFGLPSAADVWQPAPATLPAAAAKTTPAASSPAVKIPAGTIVHRQYPIRNANRSAGRPKDEEAAKLKKWFEGKGVSWPEGSTLTLPVPGILHVANTVENLKRIEAILKGLPSQKPTP